MATSDLDRQIEQLKRCELIKEAEVKALCAKAREILVEESNVQRVDPPVTVRELKTQTTQEGNTVATRRKCFGLDSNSSRAHSFRVWIIFCHSTFHMRWYFITGSAFEAPRRKPRLRSVAVGIRLSDRANHTPCFYYDSHYSGMDEFLPPYA
jgi:hypothetical protein